jgi:hypothetical protein
VSRQILIAVGAAALLGLGFAAYEFYARSQRGQEAGAEPGAAAVPASVPAQGAKPVPGAEEAADDLVMPGPGDLRLEVAEPGELTLLANNVPRRRILRALARTFDFELVDHASRHRRVTLAEVERPLEVVLGSLLHDTPYTLRYAVDTSGATVLAQLTVGVESSELTRAARRRREMEERDRRRAGRRDKDKEGGAASGDPYAESAYDEEESVRDPGLNRPPTDEERERILAGRAARQEARRSELLEELTNPDPQERIFALQVLDPRLPEDLKLLRSALQEDPHAEVRAEAALQLSFGDRSTVAGMLRSALADPDAGVILSAIESLTFVGDRSAAFRLKKLSNHPDEEVREAATTAVQDLQSMP